MELLRPSSLDAPELAAGIALAGGTEVVPMLRDGLVAADTLVDVLGLLPRGIEPTGGGTRIGAATTLAELEASAVVPGALREAARLARRWPVSATPGFAARSGKLFAKLARRTLQQRRAHA